MTSGNRQNEPIARTNDEARANLAGLADGFLWHNRPIHNRVDDSVWMVTGDGPLPLRRSRGEAPRPIELAVSAAEPILAAGSQMKNTFCLLTGNQAFLSQHIGEMDYLETWDFFVESVRRYQELFGIRPRIIAHDLHPDFTLAALGALDDLIPHARAMPIQHHHAHIAACLAENQARGPVIGLALDGTGYGPDGTVWGGEILIADLEDYRRAGRWQPFPLPGGEAAIRQPLRIALGLLQTTFGGLPPDLDVVGRAEDSLRRAVVTQVQRGINAPATTSCGRFFDATAALLGVRDAVTYEGQAAIELETLAATHPPATPYPVQLTSSQGLWEIPTRAIFREMVADLREGAPAAEIAARFHATLIHLLSQMAQRLRQETGLNQVALSGGCFQNRILLEGLLHVLRNQGFTIFTHHQVPTNDGGLSLGQAVIAASRLSNQVLV
jgi:hydrogenase maturation protein HypF